MTAEELRRLAEVSLLADLAGCSVEVAGALVPMVEGVELPEVVPEVFVTEGVKTRHGLAWCPSCGWRMMLPATTTKDGLPRQTKRPCVIPSCKGRMVVPSIPRRPKA